jgi:aminoglycoside phosphotransferase (APT) family kinase protein
LPAAPADLTPTWLTATLRCSGALGRASVVAVDPEPIAAGQGFVGQVLRLRLGYDAAEAGAPATLIAKLPAADPGVRAAVAALGLYAREAGFYAVVAAANLPVPRAYYAAADPATGAGVVLLEDLTDGRVGDNLGGCSDAQADLAVAELARLHARWWDHPRLAELPWTFDADAYQRVYEQQWGPFLAKFGDAVPPRLRELGPRAIDRAAAYRRWLAGGPRTLVHNDYRLDNLFFGRPGGARPLVVFDWQLCLVGRGVADVAYFAAFCLPPARRRAAEQGLVGTYHDGLLRHGVRGYDRERCWADYRRATLGTLLRLVAAGGLLDFSSERGAALVRAFIERIDAVLADHGTDALEAGMRGEAADPSEEGGA